MDTLQSKSYVFNFVDMHEIEFSQSSLTLLQCEVGKISILFMLISCELWSEFLHCVINKV